MIETEKQLAFMLETAKLREQPLVIDPTLKEIKICVWNTVCDPQSIPQTTLEQRIQPSICNPCTEAQLSSARKT